MYVCMMYVYVCILAFRYHYYGIGVKESSSYYDVIYSSKGVQR